VGGATPSRPSAFSKLLMACLAWPCSLDAAELVVDVARALGRLPRRGREHLLVVGERAGPVAELEAHVGEAADRLLVGEIELVRGLVGLERALVLAERASTLPSRFLQAVLLGALALAALLDQHLGERLGPLPLLDVPTYSCTSG
jgi:hypothetical protein